MALKNLHWSLYFLVWTAVITATGALLGALTFPLAGLVLDTGYNARELALSGIENLGFYFFIWAPGTAIVLCLMRGYRRRHPEAK